MKKTFTPEDFFETMDEKTEVERELAFRVGNGVHVNLRLITRPFAKRNKVLYRVTDMKNKRSIDFTELIPAVNEYNFLAS